MVESVRARLKAAEARVIELEKELASRDRMQALSAGAAEGGITRLEAKAQEQVTALITENARYKAAIVDSYDIARQLLDARQEQAITQATAWDAVAEKAGAMAQILVSGSAHALAGDCKFIEQTAEGTAGALVHLKDDPEAILTNMILAAYSAGINSTIAHIHKLAVANADNEVPEAVVALILHQRAATTEGIDPETVKRLNLAWLSDKMSDPPKTHKALINRLKSTSDAPGSTSAKRGNRTLRVLRDNSRFG